MTCIPPLTLRIMQCRCKVSWCQTARRIGLSPSSRHVFLTGTWHVGQQCKPESVFGPLSSLLNALTPQDQTQPDPAKHQPDQDKVLPEIEMLIPLLKPCIIYWYLLYCFHVQTRKTHINMNTTLLHQICTTYSFFTYNIKS